ncbi:DUF4785 domain-containing protein [Marinicella sp. W31]|uniref:DUF4785 domain-containing protein n=1 Tax=Marinicella sp. W31 TaxID=3023713 RepID=UPI003756BCE0
MKKSIIIFVLLSVQINAQAQFSAKWDTPLAQQSLAQSNTNNNAVIVNRNTEAVQFNYPLDPQQKISDKVSAHTEQSRQYWLDTTAAQLQTGLDLPISGTTAYVRISPLNSGEKNQLNPSQIKLDASSGEVQIESFVDAEQLNQAGASFTDSTIAFKVHTDAAGAVRLSIPDITNTSEAYVITVLEPESPHILKLSMDQHSYAAGSVAKIYANMKSGQQNQAANLQGYMRSADGSVIAQLRFKAIKNGGYEAEVSLPQGQSLATGLWEIHAIAESRHHGIRILRDAQSSFAVNLNTARFNGSLNAANNALSIGVEVADAGRYEIRGVLMGTDRQGQLRPLAMLMSARWLNPGHSNIAFDLEPLANKNAAFSAPFVIRQLQLTNQSRLAPVQMVNSGITLSPLSK